MNCCQSPQCRGIEETFSEEVAKDELEHFLRHGPARQTRKLIEIFQREDLPSLTLLDIGGGVGAIQHALGEGRVGRVVNVDASTAYSRTAQTEAERRGYRSRAEYHIGDFVLLAGEIDSADLVSLDRVICCYPDIRGLVKAAAGKTRKLVGTVYPVYTWYFRFGVQVINFFQILRRASFRVYAHPSVLVESLFAEAGFRRGHYQKGLLWQVAVFEKM